MVVIIKKGENVNQAGFDDVKKNLLDNECHHYQAMTFGDCMMTSYKQTDHDIYCCSNSICSWRTKNALRCWLSGGNEKEAWQSCTWCRPYVPWIQILIIFVIKFWFLQWIVSWHVFFMFPPQGRLETHLSILNLQQWCLLEEEGGRGYCGGHGGRNTNSYLRCSHCKMRGHTQDKLPCNWLAW